MKYARVIRVEAVQWDGNADTANAFLGEKYGVDWEYVDSHSDSIYVETSFGRRVVNVSDWITTENNTKFTVWADKEFNKQFRVVDL